MPETNSPAEPGIKIRGIKAKIVVIVEPSKGSHKCFTAKLTLSSRRIPSWRLVCIVSVITMALSTIIPKATTKPVTDIW